MRTYLNEDFTEISINMIRYGGSFVNSLGICLEKADSINKQKLANAFPEYFQKYFEWHL